MSAQKHALVVDDSKSARLVLRRMLEKYALTVDTANSADEAMDYLTHNRPDIIFMDHMMPGMDGFEAVKAIKRNPATATIPILMYTTKSGDLYLGQARALGAVGVLPKTVAPAELFDALQRLGMVTDRRQESANTEDETASERAHDIEQREGRPATFYEDDIPVNIRTAPTDDPNIQFRKLLEEQRVELRKDILVSMESVSRSVRAKFEHELESRLGELTDRLAPPPKPPNVPGVLLGILLFASLGWNYALYQDFKTLKNAPAPGNEPAAQTQPANAIEPASETTSTAPSMDWAFLDWAMNQTLHYPHDEIALDKARLETVETLLTKLAENGFKGKVVLQTHAGEFCLLGNEDQGYRLPPPDLPVDQCEFIGNPAQPTDSPATHQSLQFANFQNSTPLLANGSTIALEIVAIPRATPLADYPARTGDTTAQAWNAAAATNNRVIVRLEPGSEHSFR